MGAGTSGSGASGSGTARRLLWGDREVARLPGLALMIALLKAGVVYAALGASQRIAVSDLKDAVTTYALPDMRVDVNCASEAEMTLLPGIGPRLAERIVQDREQHGRFATLEDLTRVKWIGAGIVQRARPFAMAGE